MKYTFEQLPLAINTLHDKVDSIKELLLQTQQEQDSPCSELLTIRQASEFLNLSVPTLYTKVSRREIPVNKRGKLLCFSRKDLLIWIKSGRRKIIEEIQSSIKHKLTEENPPPR
ncbi:helix-turn-helix domain-containing protein [Pedobacter polysacchareus]|uniref:helix-turn-helix domain-containing protein n=1 Tax=Pedobacter polysacchareus TaxID=2861973 RepID=UPI001C9A082C|nr:helix-turn-helix domain-containing protein [Pedobacter polysacchareus]